MKEITKSQGIVIKVTDYNDACVIASVLTPQKLETILIKGAKKLTTTTHPLAQVLTMIAYNHTTSKEIALLTEGVVTDNNTILKSDLHKYHTSLVILEKAAFFAETVSDYETFYNFTCFCLELIKTTTYYYSIVNLFETKLLYLLGVNPNFSKCLRCGKDVLTSALSVKLGGVICDKCLTFADELVSINNTDKIKKIYYTKLKDYNKSLLEETNNDEISKHLDDYYAYHLEFKSKSKPVFYTMNEVL